MINTYIRIGVINPRAKYFKKYPYLSTFLKFRKIYVCYYFSILVKISYALATFEWEKCPKSQFFDAKNEIIPNQTILREKNQ